MHRPMLRFALVTGAIVAAACAYDAPVKPDLPTAGLSTSPSMQLSTAPAAARAYMIDFIGDALPANLAAQITKAGGVLTTELTQIGVAVATSDDPAFADRAARITGVFSVIPDFEIQWVDPRESVVTEELTAEDLPPAAAQASVGASETFRLVQWAPDAVSAPAAWDAGATGAGARVAVLDGGIHSTHLDIAPNLDVARSRSFVPDPDTIPNNFIPFNTDLRRDAQGVCRLTDTFWHGTHVAGILAAPAQNIGTVGIAPRATLIGVKVLHCGSGSFSWILNGIVYAATPIAEGGAGADVINMSLGAGFEHQARDTAGKVIRDTTGNVIHTARSAARLQRLIGKATTYAYQRGVTVVAALGNSATNLDKTNDLMFLPAMAPHVIAVSATGPVGWAAGATDLDQPASYTNFGQSAVDFAAPGGNDEFRPLAQLCTKPRIGGGPPVTTNCFAFDFVFAPIRGTSNGNYGFAEGTSMASPAVAGVAALIIGKFGRIGPDAVERRLRQSADDLGKPGNDDFYGSGRVNALRAIQ
ncbi:MAG TPA: S8 family serine peptidase [Gemmatimonadales bacterium]|nr:S8 family serine peptidase [Gemmatimonadales bacterium]